MRLLAFFLLLTSAATAQDADIRAAEKKWAAAIVAKDGATLEKLLGDLLTLLMNNSAILFEMIIQK